MKKTVKPAAEPVVVEVDAPPAADRQSMIEMAAYYLYERSGYCSDRALEYWLQAEAQIDDLLKTRPSRPRRIAVQAKAAEPAPAKAMTQRAAKPAAPKARVAKPAAPKPRVPKAA